MYESMIIYINQTTVDM